MYNFVHVVGYKMNQGKKFKNELVMQGVKVNVVIWLNVSKMKITI